MFVLPRSGPAVPVPGHQLRSASGDDDDDDYDDDDDDDNDDDNDDDAVRGPGRPHQGHQRGDVQGGRDRQARCGRRCQECVRRVHGELCLVVKLKVQVKSRKSNFMSIPG